jgi:arylsulfatase
MEGSLRTPFIIRWPVRSRRSRQQRDRPETDTYTTFAKIAGASAPQDRPIDGVDQTDFLLGKIPEIQPRRFPVFVAGRLEAVKWRNWKIVFYDEHLRADPARQHDRTLPDHEPAR